MRKAEPVPAPSALVVRRRAGVLILNLGTPEAPHPSEVRRYLREFLGDPRVLDMSRLGRWLLLNLVILPFRPARSAEAYRAIWRDDGSPLLVHGRALRDVVSRELGDAFVVELAMRYGAPSIADALRRLEAADVSKLIVFPLFPQYSSAATGSALDATFRALLAGERLPVVETIGAFYEDPRFIEASREVAERHLDGFRPDFVLFSYHGLPERQVRKADPTGAHCLARADCCDSIGPSNRFCYRAQCFATTRALAGALGLAREAHAVSFQSRLGSVPWIKPYTDEILRELADRGVRRLAVLCPAFVADCLETLEEIGIRAKEQWRALGGDDLLLVPSLNAERTWVRAVADLVREKTG